MRILFLLTQDLESPSGLGRYWPLARELSSLGHNVTIAALHPDLKSLSSKCFERQGVFIHYVAPMHVRKQGDKKSYYNSYQLLSIAIRSTVALTKAALLTPADIVYVCKPHPMNGIAGLAFKYLRRRPLIVDCDDYETASGRFANQWQKRVVSWFEKHIPKLANKVTTNTFFMKDKLISWGVSPDKIVYLPNGVDVTRFTRPSQDQIEILKDKLGLRDKKVVAYIGSLSLASHAVDLLLYAFSLVHSEIPNSVLLLVGGGEDIDRLKSIAEELNINDAVIFYGKVSPEQVAKYYYIADVTVDPVRDDDAARGRAPLKIFESWACGVPVVTADVGDRRRLAGEETCIYLTASTSAEELAKVLIEIINNKDLAEQLRLQGSLRVKNFYWSALAKTFLHHI